MRMKNLLKDNRFEGDLVLADFYACWSAPCRSQASVTAMIEKNFKGRAHVIRIDIDHHRDLATQYMVQSIPTLVLFENGKEIQRFIGLQPGKKIELSIQRALAYRNQSQ